MPINEPLNKTIPYEIKPIDTSRFSLAVAKTGLMKGKRHNFIFANYRGSLQLDTLNREGSQIKFIVDATSIECRDRWVNDADKKKILNYVVNDGIMAEKHPEIVFLSSVVKQKSDTTFDVIGTLTVRGISKPVSVELSVQPGKSAHLEMMGITNFKLSDFGIRPPSLAFGLTGTRDEVVVDFELVATPCK
jgi:polyisoprenoid-binding protein YceI